MKIRSLLTRFAAGLALCFPVMATADISLTYRSQLTPEYQSTILVSQAHIRFENPMTPEFYMLFHADSQRMTLVDSDKRSFSVLDRETLESLSEQIDVTRRAIIAELKAGMNVANEDEKEQMAVILEQIQQLSQDQGKPLVEYLPLNDRKEINGYPCQTITAKVSGKAHATLCATQSADLGISEAEMNTLESFHHFSSTIHQQLNPGDITELLFVMNSKQQLPISIKRTYPVGAEDEYRLTSVKNLSIPASAFQVPEGFEAKDIEDAFIVE